MTPTDLAMMSNLGTVASPQEQGELLSQAAAFPGGYLDRLSSSKLLRPEVINQLARDLVEGHEQTTVADFSAALVDRGLLTAWQDQSLWAGLTNFHVGPYRLHDLLGTGGSSLVLLGRHEVLGRNAAVKLLRAKAASDEQERALFLQEARTIAELEHPNVVRIYDFNTVGLRYYLAMEHLPGGDLERLVEEQGPLPPSQAASLIAQAAAGLAYLHAQGLVHRDVKPSNLLLDDQGTVKFIDFGLLWPLPACSADDDKVLVGTVEYLAPEQAMDHRRVTPKADIYALGCTLFKLLTGRLPFTGSTFLHLLVKHQSAPPPDVRHFRPSVPACLAKLLTHMLAKNARTRPSARKVWQLLQDWSHQFPSNQHLPRPKHPRAISPLSNHFSLAAG